MNGFEIPVVLIFFKRKDKTVEIVNRISEVRPKKLYLISDYGRNDDEIALVLETRKAVEERIDWECEVIKNYAKENMGVFDRIGLGAKWVFEQEAEAIFLEDDNLPELSFFQFCKEMLERYREESRVMWVCGTNYLEKYKPKNESDYLFTQHMLPCGWASWSGKFLKYYDFHFDLLEDEYVRDEVKRLYKNSRMYRYDIFRCESEKSRSQYRSWDMQMVFSLRAHDLYGIVPRLNQIKNIGVDEFSEHGGYSLANIMTKRFCGMDSIGMEFPLKHPTTILADSDHEKRLEKIILPPPFFYQNALWKAQISVAVRKLLGMEINKSFRSELARKFKR